MPVMLTELLPPVLPAAPQLGLSGSPETAVTTPEASQPVRMCFTTGRLSVGIW
jgi:hypothetical protein